MADPDVFVVLKEGDGYSTVDGTPLCVELTQQAARHRKVGRCVLYVPAAKLEETAKLDELYRAGLDAVQSLIDIARTEGVRVGRAEAFAEAAMVAERFASDEGNQYTIAKLIAALAAKET